MQLFKKKRLEIIAELPLSHRVTDMLEEAGVSGYTVLPVLAGRGQGGKWSREGMVGRAGQMVMVMVTTSPEKASELLDMLAPKLEDQGMVISLSDVEVVRNTHF